jgi:long-chain fatty acid transport protein
MKRYRLVLLSAWLPLTAWSGNGLNLIGFGTESVLMGGADVAVARDTTALNTNPAGLTSLGKRAADVFGGIAYGSDVRHLDSFGNDRNVSNRVIPIGGFGYAARLGTSGVTAGIGLFAQGGAGNVYENLTTAFGTVDTLSGLFRESGYRLAGERSPVHRCLCADHLCRRDAKGLSRHIISQPRQTGRIVLRL